MSGSIGVATENVIGDQIDDDDGNGDPGDAILASVRGFISKPSKVPPHRRFFFSNSQRNKSVVQSYLKSLAALPFSEADHIVLAMRTLLDSLVTKVILNIAFP